MSQSLKMALYETRTPYVADVVGIMKQQDL